MNTYTDPTRTSLHVKAVFIATDLTDDVIRGATLAIVTESSWHIFGRKAAHSFDKFSFPLPAGLKCPIVDISAIPHTLDERAKTLIVACRASAITVAALLAGLIELGAREVKE